MRYSSALALSLRPNTYTGQICHWDRVQPGYASKALKSKLASCGHPKACNGPATAAFILLIAPNTSPMMPAVRTRSLVRKACIWKRKQPRLLPCSNDCAL